MGLGKVYGHIQLDRALTHRSVSHLLFWLQLSARRFLVAMRLVCQGYGASETSKLYVLSPSAFHEAW